jgi:hypothetical protein
MVIFIIHRLSSLLCALLCFTGELRKQLDGRWKQIERFETSLKGYADVKREWKRKVVNKEGEVEALKVIISHFIVIFNDKLNPIVCSKPTPN